MHTCTAICVNEAEAEGPCVDEINHMLLEGGGDSPSRFQSNRIKLIMG